jgi:hypothetical protein
MSEVGDAINEARTEVGAAPSEFLPDLCNLIKIGLVTDGKSGMRPGETVIASNVPCKYDEASKSPRQFESGHVGYESTHVLTFGASATTMAITPEYIVKVMANGDRPITFFEQPIKIKGSMQVFVKFRAKETTGPRAPVNV